MMNEQALRLIKEAKTALRAGDRRTAWEIGKQLVTSFPDNLEGWLLLAGLASAESSMLFLEKAAAIAPDDPRVRKAIVWAQDRMISEEKTTRFIPKRRP